MNRVRITAAFAALVLLGTSPVIADNHEEAGPDFRPVEIFACNFVDGMGPDDLDAVNAKWNEWMDAEGADDYFAALMYPNYHNDIGFDVAWIGSWRDGNAMGAGTDSWLSSDTSALRDEYDAVVNCPSHSLFASARMKDPGESGEDDGNFVLSFRDCSVGEGKTMDDVRAAQEAWNAYADEHGFKGGTWYLWPVWGAPQDAEYDFKAVGSAPNYTTVGSNFQLMAEGHWRKSQEIWDGALDCDSSRIYSTKLVRSMPDEDE